MIEVVNITQNPVTAHEQFSLDLAPGRSKRNWSDLSVTHRAYGGFWNASLTMHDTEVSLRDFFSRGLGRQVRFRSDIGTVDFEGFINSMSLVGAGGLKITTTLDSTYNDIWVRYKDSAGTFARSAVSQDTDSQNRFGDKELVLSAGQITATSIATGLATQVLNRKRWPKRAPENLSLGQGRNAERSLEIRCLGYIRTLEWRTYNQTASTGTQSADLQIADIISGTGQFVADTDLKANPIGATRVYDADRDSLSIIMDIARLGDAQNPPQRWVVYMREGRVLAYEPAAPEQLISA